MIRSILPARPLQLRGGYRLRHHLLAIFILLLGVGMLGAVPLYGGEILEAGRDQDVWDHGVRATDESIQGSQHTHSGLGWLLAWYDVRVAYLDQRGKQHKGDVSLTTMLGELEPSEEVEIRYDPAHPEHFAVGWAIAARAARYRGAIAMLLLGGFFGCVLIRAAWRVRRRLQRDQQIAAEGTELELRVVKRQLVVARGKVTGEARYELEIPPANGVGKPRIHIHNGPLLLECGSEGERAVALALPGDHKQVLIVHEDLSPLVVTEAERESALARAAPPDAV